MLKKTIYLFLKKFGKKYAKSMPENFKKNSTSSFYDFKLKSIEGKKIDFSIYKNKNLLIVNTASECGYTAQYEELEKLHQTHGNKIIILGFPSNNFGGQEPGSNEDIKLFCQKNYGVSFQLFQKSDVIGENINPLYFWLTNKEQNGWNELQPKWNFCKYLIDKNGNITNYFSSAVSPLSNEITDKL